MIEKNPALDQWESFCKNWSLVSIVISNTRARVRSGCFQTNLVTMSLYPMKRFELFKYHLLKRKHLPLKYSKCVIPCFLRTKSTWHRRPFRFGEMNLTFRDRLVCTPNHFSSIHYFFLCKNISFLFTQIRVFYVYSWFFFYNYTYMFRLHSWVVLSVVKGWMVFQYYICYFDKILFCQNWSIESKYSNRK